MKKFKAIIGVIWFVISLILMFLCCYRYQDFIAISLINVGISFGLLVSDTEIANMELW